MHASRRLAILAACFGLLTGCGGPGGLKRPLPAVASVHDASFQYAMGSALRTTFVPGNKIITLNNGNEIFPSMLAAIRGARHSITFETYVYDESSIAQEFTEAFAERARHGVHVKIVLDAFGGATRSAIPPLRQSGAEVEIYHALSWDLMRYNHRNHRKILVVDGRIGFIGGVGIADEWRGAGHKTHEWRDLHYRVEGPVVAQLQGVFQDDWLRTRGEVLQGSDYYPAPKSAGQSLASVFYNTPRRDERYTDLMLHLAIASSRKTLLIETPYFVPNDATCEALAEAVQRGVRVRIIMPGHKTDEPMTRRASKRRWPRLLAAGVELYEYQPCLIHSKLLIVDGRFVSVGSANLDPRSRSLNEEANMNVLDEVFAREQTHLFEDDLKYCKRALDPKSGSLLDLPEDFLEQQLEDQL